MARPRKDQEGPDARTRIVDAFWAMLAEGPYSSITVRGLASKARVNHNTIYRHFESVEGVAMTAIDEIYSPEAASQILALFANPELIDAEHLAEQGLDARLQKAILAMHSGSPTLITAVQGAIRERWMQVAGTSWNDLSNTTKLELSFILGGITSLLQTVHDVGDMMMAKSFMTSRIGIAARDALNELASPMNAPGFDEKGLV